MKKKLLITLAVILLLIFAALILLPIVFEAKIGSLLKDNVNAQIEGEFDFEEAQLSLISSFPKAILSLDGALLIAPEPFEGDTLLYAGSIDLEMGITEIFKGAGDPITLKDISIDGARLNLKVNDEGRGNYKITGANPEENPAPNSEADFSFSLESYSILNTEISYSSSPSKIDLKIYLEEHRGSGDFSLNQSKLDTQTKGLLSLHLDSISYLKDTPLDLKALIGMDLEQNRYHFLENEAFLKDLALVFEGEIQVKESHQEIDISFNAPSADFKDFIALMPDSFLQDFGSVEVSGDLEVSGSVNGISSDETIPGFNIRVKTENASIQYADLPRPIEQITLDASLVNTTGRPEGTQLDVQQSSFTIAQDRFQLKAKVSDLLGNKEVALSAQTKMNLGQLGEAYPLPAKIDLSGNLDAAIRTSFAVKDLETNNLTGIMMDGSIDLRNFEYKNETLGAPLKLSSLKAKMVNDETIIQQGDGSVGQSDFQLIGSVQHLLGYSLGKQNLLGNLDLRSNRFLVADFTNPEDQERSDENASALKIPTDLDLRLNTMAGTIVYDDLELKDFQGRIRISNGMIDFQEVTTGFFEGNLALQGSLNTLTEQPEFALALDMESLQIQKAFEAMELLQSIAPVAGALKGKFSSQVELAGSLNNDYRPDLSTMTGAVLAEILTADVQTQQLPVLTELNSSFNFFDANKLDLKGLKTALSFENGRVKVKPFNIKYDDISIRVDGGHGFDRSLDYQLSVDVPARYLGNEIQGMVAKIGEEDLKDLSIPVNIGLAGTHTSPKISSDLSSGVKSLTGQLVELQKQKLINKGSDEAKSLLGGLLGNKSDTTEIDKEDNTLGNVLKGLTTKPKDSLDKDSLKKDANPLEQKATGLLKGLLKGKKKDTTKKDSKSN